jgi:hypothetical protein
MGAHAIRDKASMNLIMEFVWRKTRFKDKKTLN